jgi:2-amino-4-hydroxy-6-hydroxymethyldihydropteridine diphosphokinase
MAKGNRVYISIGSNLGDKRANCEYGIATLVQSGHAILKARSPFYQTEPVDYLDQDWFVNAVIAVKTHLSPRQLLAELQAIQASAGRVKDHVRFGPRILDLDILLYDDVVLETSQLKVPHPRMHKRRFVLQPICDIDPKIVHPVLNVSMQTLLSRLDENDQKIVAVS